MEIAAVRERLANVKPQRALMLVGHQPIVAVGAGTYLDELMRLARADNIVRDAGEQWPHLSMEFIIAMRPEVILDGSMGTDPSASGDFWKKYPHDSRGARPSRAMAIRRSFSIPARAWGNRSS